MMLPGKSEAGRDFDDLLMTALHRTIALVQMNHIAVLVAENLHLDVLGARNVFLEEHRRIAERAFRLRLRLVQQVRQIAGFVDHPHAAPAAAERRLDDQRKTDFLRRLQRLCPDPTIGSSLPGSTGTLIFLRQRARGRLVAHHVEQLRTRPDKRDSRLGAGAGEIRVLGQKPVAGMNRVHALFLRQRDDAVNVEIRGDRALALADEVGLVRLEAMEAEPILLRVDRHRAKPEFRRRAEDADGDFAAIGDEQFFERTPGAIGRVAFLSAHCRHSILL